MSGVDTKTLGEYGFMVIDGDRGKHYPRQNEFFATGHCLFLNAGNVTRNGFNFNELMFVDENKDALMGKGKLRRGDIVITTRGTIGNTAHYDENVPYDCIRINSGMAIIRGASDAMTPNFLMKYLYSAHFKREIERLSFGSAQPQLTISILNKLRVPGPELKVQKQIVKALDLWDEYLEKLDKKIELKKNIKNGLMQQLLTGKKRLPGFDEDWKSSTLHDLATISTGKKDVNAGNPNGEYPFFTCSRKHTYSDNYSYDFEAILIAGNADVGHCKYYNGKFEAYQRTYILSNFNTVQGKYLFHYMSYFFKNYVESLKQIGAMSFIKLPMLKSFTIQLPSPAEQEAISRLLDTAEDEINYLERCRELISNERKYLLNNLISGRIRTPENLTLPAKEVQYA